MRLLLAPRPSVAALAAAVVLGLLPPALASAAPTGLSSATSATLAATTPLALQPGERLTFRVSWGPFGNAGEIDVSAVPAGDAAHPLTEVRVRTTSAGFIRTLYAFDGEARSLFDPADGRLLAASAVTRSKKRRTDASITLDHTAARADYVDHLDAKRSVSVPLPGHRPMDLVTSLVEARAWSLRPGDKFPVSVLFDDEFYELTLHALRHEKVRTAGGRREALLVTPRMDGKPRGLFKRGGEIRVWLDRDPPHLPLRFEVETKAGTAVALLTDYRPPGADAPQDPPPTPAPSLAARTARRR
jgi:hypothetical protein